MVVRMHSVTIGINRPIVVQCCSGQKAMVILKFVRSSRTKNLMITTKPIPMRIFSLRNFADTLNGQFIFSGCLHRYEITKYNAIAIKAIIMQMYGLPQLSGSPKTLKCVGTRCWFEQSIKKVDTAQVQQKIMLSRLRILNTGQVQFKRVVCK